MEKLKKVKGAKSLPNMQVGVRELGNIRMKLMFRPICPVVDSTDQWAGEANCQFATNNTPGWWIMCENKGHDPYWTVTKKTVMENDVDPETGYITGKKERVVETRRPNLSRVPDGTRFASGQAVQKSKIFKGRKTLTEMGYNEKCEFRNCEVDAEYQSKYGIFCSERHARLIGADVEGVFLNAVPAERGREPDFRAIDVEFEGAVVKQRPAGGL